jgi:predicted alpha/beta-hydrolase family hydrolase
MTPLLLFAPGAGAPSSHLWMQNWKKRLSGIGAIETFDYDYMREGRKRPDPLPKLIAAHRKALRRARERYRPESTILVGKSMGGRVGCHVSLEEKVDGLICLGYPLCAMGDRTKLRDEAPNFLNVVEGGDHSLRVPKRRLQANGRTQEDIDRQIVRAIAGFVDQLSMTAD